MKKGLKTLLTIVILTLISIQTNADTKPKPKKKQTYARVQIKWGEYSMGSVYNRGILGLQSGVRVEAFLKKGTLIPEFQVNRDWLNMEKRTYNQKEIKPFFDIKAGVRFGKQGTSNWKNLHCIDRVVRNGDWETTYYENDKVTGDKNTGLAAGLYLSRSFINPFTKESAVEASASLFTQCIYIGIANTKYIDSKSTRYKSGNTCTWDKYAYFYANALLALNYTLSDNYYNAGSSYKVKDNEKSMRSFKNTGFLVGYENGRMRKGFVGNFELGAIPSFKGKGFYFKTGASYVIGILK